MSLPNFPASVLFGLQRLLLFRHRSVKQNRMEGLYSVLFDRTEGYGPNGGPLFGHSSPFGQTWPNEGPPFGQTGSNKGTSFNPVWPNSAGREGALEAGEDRYQKAEEGHRKRAGAGE